MILQDLTACLYANRDDSVKYKTSNAAWHLSESQGGRREEGVRAEVGEPGHTGKSPGRSYSDG